MFNSTFSKLQTLNDEYADKVVQFIQKSPESDESVKQLRATLKTLEADSKFYSLYSDTETTFTNLAGQAAMHSKQRFLQCILDFSPKMLYEEHFEFYKKKLRIITPLNSSVKDRKIDMVKFILGHPVFKSHMDESVESSCYQLFSSYMWALLWYNNTKTQDEMGILQMLSTACKEAMMIAYTQGKDELPQDIMQKFAVDGVIEGFLQHKDPILIKHQLRMTEEVCTAYSAQR